jgi:hypothetical protein
MRKGSGPRSESYENMPSMIVLKPGFGSFGSSHLVGFSEYPYLRISDGDSVGWRLSHVAMLLAEPAMSVDGPARYYSFQTLLLSRSTEVSTNPYLGSPIGGPFFWPGFCLVFGQGRVLAEEFWRVPTS